MPLSPAGRVEVWRWIRLIGALAGLLLGSTLVAGRVGAKDGPRELRVGIIADFPPYQIWPEGGEPSGADLDLLRRVAPALGASLAPQRYTDQRTLEADLRAGRLDLATSMARTPEREAEFLFTAPYATIDQAMVVRADDSSSTLAPDLAGRRLALVAGYASEAVSRRLFPLASPVVFTSLDEALHAVIDDRADVLIEARPVILGLIEQKRLSGLRIARTLALPGGTLHFAAGPTQAMLLQALDAALAGVDAETRATTVQRWTAVPHFAQVRAGPLFSDAEQRLLQAQPPLRIAVVGSRGPFASMDADGQPQGISVDMLRDLLARAGLKEASWQGVDAGQALGLLARGQADLAVGLTQSTAQSEAVQFIGHYIEHPLVLVGPPDSGAWGLETLVGRRLALPAVHFARPMIAARWGSMPFRVERTSQPTCATALKG